MKLSKSYLKKEVGEKHTGGKKHEKKESKAKERMEHNPMFKKILGKKK